MPRTKAQLEERWKNLVETVATMNDDAESAWRTADRNRDRLISSRAEGYYDGFATATRYVKRLLEDLS
jgi:hypothetical protein